MEINRLIDILNRMESLQQEFFSELRGQLIGATPFPSPSPKDSEKLMGRLEVMAYLQISNATYKRKVMEGSLKPLKLPGGHKYHKSDLLGEYSESKRRGRI